MGQEIKHGYKVVYEKPDGSLWSIAVVGKGGTRYGTFWALPKLDCGPLCVFKTFEAATKSVIKGSIFECSYVQSNENIVWHDIFCEDLRRLPCGTALADRVKFGKQVYP